MNLFPRTKSSPAPLLEEAKARFASAPSAPLSTILQFLLKRAAKHLKNHLAAKHNVTLNHGQALDAISASLGFADWNTANAATNAVAEESLDTAEAAQVPAAIAAVTARRLSSTIDFSTNTIVIGPAGCGKSVALLFAAQRARALEQGRPVVIVRGPESPRYQPNWTLTLSQFDNVETLATVDTGRAVSPQDKLEVAAPEDDWSQEPAERQRHQEALVSGVLDWLRRRAHLKPLVLVEEAFAVLGKDDERLMREAPHDVTFIWTAQVLQDMGPFEQVAARFRVIHLMRGSARSMPPGFGRLIEEDEQTVLSAVSRLELGEAVQLFVRALPLSR